MSDDDATQAKIKELTAQRKALETELAALQEAVRALKSAEPKDDAAIGQAVTQLRAKKEALKKTIKAYTGLFAAEKLDVNREALEDLLRRRFFYANSFEIYNGSKGLVDLGPPGCAVQAAMINLWRQTFVYNENNLEMDCTALTMERVLEVSKHTEKFCDFMIEDLKGDQFIRADHMLEDWIDARLDEEPSAEEEEELRSTRARADEMNQEELHAALKKYYRPPAPVGKKKKKAKDGPKAFEDEWKPPREFNVMFSTALGPSGKQKAFLRPETAQGMFVNFRRLLDFAGNKLPFGAAQVGKAFRNEISPGQGLLRLREFTLAEVEYFVHPRESDHPRFDEVADVEMRLFASSSQLGDRRLKTLTAGEAVKQGVLKSQNLAYFMARTWSFLVRVGCNPKYLRMRQHLPNEMAHYARDCWDAEILTSYGWIECVGHADRAAFDLGAHAEGSGQRLDVHVAWPQAEWKTEEVVVADVNPKKMGKALKRRMQAAKKRCEELASEEPEAAMELQALLEKDGKAPLSGLSDGDDVELTSDMVTFKRQTNTIKGETLQPHVIEPAFGIGRIMYSIFEHTFRERKVEAENNKQKRNFLALPAIVAPTKFSVLPLVTSSQAQRKLCFEVRQQLSDIGASSKLDLASENIGRRYARTDEIGIPYGITVDLDSEKDRSVTLRERDSCKQVRLQVDDLAKVAAELLRGDEWDVVVKKYDLPAFEA